MESKKGKTISLKIISYISIIALVFWNIFFVYWSDNSDIIEEIDFFSTHNHDHNHNQDNIDENFIDLNLSWTRIIEQSISETHIEIEWILEQVIWEWLNGYMEETYLLYDESYWKSFILDFNNVIDESYIWSRVILWWIDWDDIFIVKSLLSNQTVLQSNVAAVEFTPETKNIRNVAVFMVNVNWNTPIWSEELSESKIFWNIN